MLYVETLILIHRSKILIYFKNIELFRKKNWMLKDYNGWSNKRMLK